MGGPFDSFLDVSGIDFGRTKEISEVRGTSLKFNLDVRWQSQGVIYVVRPLNGSPGKANTVNFDQTAQGQCDLGLHCLHAILSKTLAHKTLRHLM